jgi:hypothetical protein
MQFRDPVFPKPKVGGSTPLGTASSNVKMAGRLHATFVTRNMTPRLNVAMIERLSEKTGVRVSPPSDFALVRYFSISKISRAVNIETGRQEIAPL